MREKIIWKRILMCVMLMIYLLGIPVDTFAAEESASFTGNERYDQIIRKYIEGINAKWTLNDFIENGLCYVVSYDPDLNEIGYYLVDLDSDGTEELLIGQIREDGGLGIIYELYTVNGNETKSVFSSAERISYSLCEGNVICCNRTSGGDLFDTSFYDFTDGELILREAVSFDAQHDAENPWFYSTTSNWGDYNTPITEEEAKSIEEAYKRIAIAFVPLSEVMNGGGQEVNKDNEVAESQKEANGSLQNEASMTESNEWKSAYIEYIEQHGNIKDSFGSLIDIYKLVNIDNDDIPELYADFGSTVAGGVVCIYSNGKVIEQNMWNYGFSYIEGQNLFADTGGMMDHYYNKVYCVHDGEIVLLYSGEYGAPDNSQVQLDSEGYPIYNYSWNGTPVSSEAEYSDLFNGVYNTQMAVKPFDGAEFDSEAGRFVGNGLCDYYEIIDAINNY